MVERNAGVADDQKIVFRIGIHVGDVVEEADGDLMGLPNSFYPPFDLVVVNTWLGRDAEAKIARLVEGLRKAGLPEQ
jgi:hypothetical protein